MARSTIPPVRPIKMPSRDGVEAFALTALLGFLRVMFSSATVVRRDHCPTGYVPGDAHRLTEATSLVEIISNALRSPGPFLLRGVEIGPL